MPTNLNQYRKKKRNKQMRKAAQWISLIILVTFLTVSTTNIFKKNVSLIVANYNWEPAIILNQ